MTTVTIDRALLEQALDAHILSLPYIGAGYKTAHTHDTVQASISALRAALTAQPQTLDEAMAVPRAMAQAYENGYNAALANGPAWHDVPTESGWWVCNEGDDNPYRWTTHRVTFPINQFLVGEDEMWYGPIPQDGEKS